MAYGGPSSLADIPAFLAHIRGCPPSPELLERTTERYRLIGGSSPLPRITLSIAGRLQDATGLPVYVGMRHWHPYLEDAVAGMARTGVRRGLAICLAPQFSATSVGAYARRVQAAADGFPEMSLDVTLDWHLQPRLVAGLTSTLMQTLHGVELPGGREAGVIFTAHSLPRATLPPGDPYVQQVLATASAVAQGAGLGRDRWVVGYQSASGTGKGWLGPSAEEALERMVAGGHRKLVVCPVGFLVEQVEILYDLDLALKHRAMEMGAGLERTPMLNDGESVVAALRELVENWKGEDPE
jgi:protoporphyrin/coproporphyrin ferrochelatase